MQLITRKQLGWPASAAPLQATTKGVKVHYTGGHVPTAVLKDHSLCIALWRDIREAHLANVHENYSDVAYNYAACGHGYVLEGRGIGKRTGANGNQVLNRAHYAVLGLIGSSGVIEPTDELLNAIRDAIEHLQEHGAGEEIKGHRDGKATACPGGPLYAWVQKGAPRPGGKPADGGTHTVKAGDTLTAIAKRYSTTVGAIASANGLKDPDRISVGQQLTIPDGKAPTAKPSRPVVDFSRVREAALKNPPAKGQPVTYAGVKTVEDALVKEGLLSKSLADGHFGSATVTAYAGWQRRCGWRGAAADGIPGKASLTKLGKRRGFDVKE
ncbi:LysM peptidoglycan-binding domain-containing protein [Streptomyces sp. NPDC002838]|uniref:LysM peptidoglycan-binding domain-containing protein n=1 Tax=Streptomyces sp. NPDC002838 TaxID=3154436 RepID=UPI00331E9D8E